MVRKLLEKRLPMSWDSLIIRKTDMFNVCAAGSGSTAKLIPCENLEKRGIDVLFVPDAQAALRITEEYEFDLLILDQTMPYMEFNEEMHLLRLNDPRIPIIVLGAENDEYLTFETFRAGANMVIHRPVEPEELQARIETLLELTAPAS
jgi:putative two-component system response regulator